MHYPELIEAAACDVAELTKEINAIRIDMREIEIEQIGEVLSACDEASGKPIFTNDKQRDYALAARLQDHTQYRHLRATLADKEMEKGTTAARLERLRGEFKLHLIEASAGSDWLSGIAESLDKIATNGVPVKPY
jgi:hypothetical protein